MQFPRVCKRCSFIFVKGTTEESFHEHMLKEHEEKSYDPPSPDEDERETFNFPIPKPFLKHYGQKKYIERFNKFKMDSIVEEHEIIPIDMLYGG